MVRICLTLFLLPVAGVALMLLYFFLVVRELNWTTVVQGLWFGIYIAMSALPMMLLLGGPLLALAAWRHWWRAWQSMVGGAVLAGALPLAGALQTLQDERLRLWYRLDNFANIVPWFLGGALYGLVFWLVAIRGNPLAALRPISSSSVVAGERSRVA